MKKIETKNKNEYLYVGTFDTTNDNKLILIESIEMIPLDISKAVNSNNEIEKYLSLEDLKEVCRESSIKATIFPNGNLSFRKLDSSTDELKSCYLSIVSTNKNKYVVCIAFDETQPMLYKAQLISLFLLDKH